jgi:hypothetical protein
MFISKPGTAFLLLGLSLAALPGLAGTAAAQSCPLGLPCVPTPPSRTPGNEAALNPYCTKIEYFGYMIKTYCWDKNNVVFRSEIDVRACAGHQVALDASMELRCRAQARR